jgi:hypothetical protein
MRTTIWFVSIAVLAAVPASADRACNVPELTKCADIAAAADRLQCFDSAAAAAKTALVAPSAETPAVRETGVQTEQEEEGGGVLEWFGLSRPVTKTEDFGKPPMPTGPQEIKEISASVLEFAKNPYGRSIFILDNGQVWKQIDGDQTEVRDPSKGETMKVSIETGMLGSYSLRVEGRKGIVKVRRIK